MWHSCHSLTTPQVASLLATLIYSHLCIRGAANALLDRAYGRPAVKEEQEIVDLPPVVIELTQSMGNCDTPSVE